MKNKNLIWIFVTVFLVIVIIVLSVLLFMSKGKEEVLYPEYNNNLIHINQPDNVTSYANILYDNYVALFSSYNISNLKQANVIFTFYDSKNRVVSKEKLTNIARKDGKTFFMAEIPDLGDKYAGNIDIDITLDKSNYNEVVDLSKITYEETHNILENNNLSITIQGVNNTGSNLKNLSGNIILTKNDKIVDQAYFNIEGALAAGTFTTNYEFPAEIIGDRLEAVDFDKIYVYFIDATVA